jgi:Ran GTPase-activating protein (RanGAP) involved in mRNA processing and transport
MWLFLVSLACLGYSSISGGTCCTHPSLVHLGSVNLYCFSLLRSRFTPRSLGSIQHLDCLGLSDNRLTAVSLPTIIEHISYSTLVALDLSFNTMHGWGVQALANYFKAKTVLQDVDLSNCGILCSDAKMLCSVLSMYTNQVEELRLSCNAIGEEGAQGKRLISCAAASAMSDEGF